MKKIFQIVAIFFLVIASGSLRAQSNDTILKVSKGLYEIEGLGGNISVLVTTQGVILIDAGNSPADGQKILKHIASVTNQPIKYTIITHSHLDHVGGLAALPSNVIIYAHKNVVPDLREREAFLKNEVEKELPVKIDSLKKLSESQKAANNNAFKKTDSLLVVLNKTVIYEGSQKVIYPKELVDSLKTLYLGNDTIQLIYPGPAHTNGDLVVYIKSKNIYVMGDLLFTHSFPYINSKGNIENWAKQLKYFSSRNASVYIPGHMGLAKSDDLLVLSNYLTDLMTEVKRLKDQGSDLDSIKKNLNLPAYSTFGLAFLKDQNVELVYNQLKR
jgi:cyclase